MTNEPVQIILNPRTINIPRERTPPGSNGKDFYANRSVAFAAHRDELATSLRQIIAALSASRGLGHVKVVMASNATAKSHRPQRALFRARWTPHVATDNIGEPIFAATPAGLAHVLEAIEQAEAVVAIREDAKGVRRPTPTRNRCEVSAIESITLWTPDNKRHFSAEDGASWLRRPDTGGAYMVDLFPTGSASHDSTLSASQARALNALSSSFQTTGVVAELRYKSGRLTLHSRVVDESSALSLEASSPIRVDGLDRHRQLLPVSSDLMTHNAALSAIESNPMVRRITLPPVVEPAAASKPSLGAPVPEGLFERDGVEDGAAIGIIDGGVGDVLADWVERRWGQLADDDRELNHGTFIAGLLVAAGSLNTYLADYPHGCRIFDVDVLPDDPGLTGIPFGSYYPGGVPDFMDEVEEAIAELHEQHGVRVFNFSMNFRTPVQSNRYGYVAQRLDQIAAERDVIIVISAGNLPPTQFRTEWPSNTASALASLVGDTRGLLAEPGESLFNVSVSALNPPGLDGQVPAALARYSRRGPGLIGAVKPDVAATGGSGSPSPSLGSGLFSVDPGGLLVAEAGTSFAAPLVAKALADLDSMIEGNVSREILIAMLIHYAQTPELFTHKDLRAITRDAIGFGVPVPAAQMLERSDSEISIVMDSVLRPREDASLDFSWPEALVTDGSCRGEALLTIVATPQLAYEHGAERVRMNVGAKLSQQQEDGAFHNQLTPVHAKRPARDVRTERDLLEDELKWQIVKSFKLSMPKGRGKSSNWRFFVEYLARAEEVVPEAGVRFAAVLTIRDPKGSAPVFQQVRQELTRQNIVMGNIRTSAQAQIRA